MTKIYVVANSRKEALIRAVCGMNAMVFEKRFRDHADTMAKRLDAKVYEAEIQVIGVAK